MLVAHATHYRLYKGLELIKTMHMEQLKANMSVGKNLEIVEAAPTGKVAKG